MPHPTQYTLFRRQATVANNNNMTVYHVNLNLLQTSRQDAEICNEAS